MISSLEQTLENGIPVRYEVRTSDDDRILRCRETPGVAVSLERTSFSEAEAKKLGERVILLDGAGSFGPLVDNDRRLYNLDHHDACVRAFTLASCEQALTLVVKGLPLDKGTWTVHANDPDLDTVFAIWVLLNHQRLRELSPEGRDRIVPLIRLEGAIDANGFESAEYCGLPAQALIDMRSVLDRLQHIENEVKAAGSWSEMDLYDYTKRMLLEIDQIVYESEELQEFASVEEEYDHLDIGDDRVAVVCRDSSGIYEVEQWLKRSWGDKLGLIVLENEKGNFTLRRSASLARIDLERLYARLNRLDPAVDGRPPDKRWGGSDEIGGSPRPGGTRLSPHDIITILRDTFRPPRFVKQVIHFTNAVLFTLALVVAIGVAIGLSTMFDVGATRPQVRDWAWVTLLPIVAGVALTWHFSGGRAWLYGWRRWAGRDWWFMAPVALLGAAVGAAWTPRVLDATAPSLLLALAVAVMGSLAAEIWFRGFVHGLFLLDAKVQDVGGTWLLSRAALVSALLYAVAVTIAGQFILGPSPLAVISTDGTLETFVGALAAGFALGVIRERSLSIWPCVGLQIAGSLMLVALRL